MDEDAVKASIRRGLAAMGAGAERAAQASAEISAAASYPAMKQLLSRGDEVTKQWAGRIDRGLARVGGAASEDPVLEALFDQTREIIRQAPDTSSRDRGIIACGQIGLHYWIAAFSTTASYAEHLGLEGLARDMKPSSDEARQPMSNTPGSARDLLRG